MYLVSARGHPLTLAYCTNVVAAPTVDALCAAIVGTWNDVRERTGCGRLGLGLWFPRGVAAELARSADQRARLRDALAAACLDVVTFNAFPAEAFHADVVKEAVYRPDWLDPLRAEYTVDVALIAAALREPGDSITLSTLPLGYPKWSAQNRNRAASRLVDVALRLSRLRAETGVTVSVALEPEPCCALERTDETLAFFDGPLRTAAEVAMRAQGLGDDDAAELVRRHLGVCLDLCHAAVEHEDPVKAFERCRAAGVVVRKVQVSAALRAADPGDAATRAALTRFVEPRWLHQTGGGCGRVVRDLPDALAADAPDAPWNVHFHVPLHLAEVGGLPTTRKGVAGFLRHVAAVPRPPVLELETYTWSVVPGAEDALADNIARELTFVRDTLRDAGARPNDEGATAVKELLLVCAGGAVGSGARHLVASAVQGAVARTDAAAGGFPWGTLVVNAVGSYLLALVLAWGTGGPSPTVRLLVGTGVLGGFTTYSAFNYEVLWNLQNGRTAAALAYCGTTLVSCLLLGLLGVLSARALSG